MKVFITDASYKHTLGVVRSLGKKGIYVICGSSSPYSQAFYSKYCKERVVYPDPKNEKKFIVSILKYLKENQIDVLLPIGYTTTMAISKHKKEISQYTKLAVADWQSMEKAGEKDKTFALARKIGILSPRNYTNLKKMPSYPIVAKGKKESGQIRYINNKEELSQLKLKDYILQEYIPGEGYGFFALCDKGQIKAYFMHKRLREYPSTGGASTAAEATYDKNLLIIGSKLLKALNWQGVAMVEFKKDNRDGEFKLIEINPKFWGSLDLALAAGVDFPYLTVQMAMNHKFKLVTKYNKKIKFRWLFPDDILHLLATPRSIIVFFRDFFDNSVKSNIWWDDFKPNLFQILITGPIILRRIKNGSFLNPNGVPKVKK
jgi:predicted ATP-grasp superfamily ATP-dependent carboligase